MERLFEGAGHADAYAKYRPVYPPEVFKAITDYCREGGASFRACLDVGCGSGQSTHPLAEYYENVTGLDVSEQQIKAADKTNPKVTFKVGSAESMDFVDDGSVDLITIAQAFHWLNHDRYLCCSYEKCSLFLA